MQPEVTIIIPVYNAEPYLRECLDSVVNQTLRNLQIICVNDGSTDGSLAILEEYAAKDSRLTILNQKNQGSGAARNNAIPCIRGKYAYFMDHDDWVELDLCEKVSQEIEKTNADIVYFMYEENNHNRSTVPAGFDAKLPNVRTSPEDRADLLIHFNAPWNKLWKSDFLVSKNIRFFKGPYDDMLANWKGCVSANRIAILDETLYHWRIHCVSYSQTLDEKHYSIIETLQEIEKTLRELNLYSQYRDVFLLEKLLMIRRTYMRLPLKKRPVFREMVKNSLTNDDRDFIQTNSNGLSKKVQNFYQMLEDETSIGRLKFRCVETGSRFFRWCQSQFKSRI